MSRCYPLPRDSQLARLKQTVKRSPLGGIWVSRRFQAYGVGLERTGTTFLARIFGKEYRSFHEAEWERLIELHTGESPLSNECSGLREWLRERDRALRLEFESSHLLGSVAPALADEFPGSKFIVTIRHPRAWLRSVTDWQLNRDVLKPESPWRPLFDLYYGTSGDYDSPVLKRYGLYTLDGYLQYWTSHYRQILDGVPPDRLLLLRTENLSQSLGRISEFVGIPEDHLRAETGRSNRNPKRHDMLEHIDSALLEEKIQRHCGALLNEFSMR
jgi:hypothetical protein